MNQRLLYLSLAFSLIGFMPQVSAQEAPSFDTQFSSIDTELTKWDPVRGKWLGNSLKAMSANEPIPDRTFPEDFSPAEMLALVPATTVESIRTISQSNSQNSRDLLARERWERIHNYTNRPNCSLVMGRTYGDPHLKSFDGASYSFQTVGEFVLASANNGQFEVQVRQQPESDNISLNTAVAMRVGGDRLGIYASSNRPGFQSPVMLNGMPIEIGSNSYYLPHGGTITHSGRNYLVTWPTGEKVSVDLSNSGSMRFMNVAVQVFPCASSNYFGLMGNANGNPRDDFNVSSNSSVFSSFGNNGMNDQMEKERLAFLAKDFANYFRVTPMNSLFDYGFGENTLSYTDYSYPRVHRTINDLTVNQRNNARNRCEAAGLRGDDLTACIYDNGFLNIEPVSPPVIPTRTNNVTLRPVDREVPNVNPPRQPISVTNGRENQNDNKVNTRPISNEVVSPAEIRQPEAEQPKWNSREVNSRNGEPSSPEVQPAKKVEDVQIDREVNSPPVKPTKTETPPVRYEKPKEIKLPTKEVPTSPKKVERPSSETPNPKPSVPAPARPSTPAPAKPSVPAPSKPVPSSAPAKSAPAPVKPSTPPVKRG